MRSWFQAAQQILRLPFVRLQGGDVLQPVGEAVVQTAVLGRFRRSGGPDGDAQSIWLGAVHGAERRFGLGLQPGVSQIQRDVGHVLAAGPAYRRSAWLRRSDGPAGAGSGRPEAQFQEWPSGHLRCRAGRPEWHGRQSDGRWFPAPAPDARWPAPDRPGTGRCRRFHNSWGCAEPCCHAAAQNRSYALSRWPSRRSRRAMW